MTDELTFIGLTLAVLIMLVSVVLRRRGVRFAWGSFVSASGSLIAFLVLAAGQRAVSLPGQGVVLAEQWLSVLGTVLVTHAGVQLIKWMVTEHVVSPRRLHIPHFVLDLVGWIVLVAVALLVASQVFAFELTGVLVSSTVVSAILALSLQQLLSSLFAGLALQMEAAFQVDDWVEVDGQEGRVVRLNWRTLAIVTRRNELVSIPNARVVQTQIINYARPSPLVAQDFLVSLAYHHSPSKVKTVLREALLAMPGLDPSTPPDIIVHEFAGYGIVYRVRLWSRDYGLKNRLHDEASTRVWFAVRRAGMDLIGLTQDLNLRFMPEARGPAQPVDRQREVVATLQSVALFEGLTEAQLQQLAGGVQLHSYTTGEALVREGEAGDSMYVIRAGQVSIQAKSADGRPVEVAQRGAGTFFGEMSLLTGAPRTASVIALDETEVVVIGKQAFTEVLAADPSILEHLLAALDRRQNNRLARLAEDGARAQQAHAATPVDLRQRIRHFLGLLPVGNRHSKE